MEVTTPLIIYSDHPAAPTGLGRATKDLAVRIHEKLPQLRIATVGYGSPGSIRLPFPQYHWDRRSDFVFPEFPHIWQDFVGEEEGILLTIHDITRMWWLADPSMCQDRPLGAWLQEMRHRSRLKIWGYFPIDAEGLQGKLPLSFRHTLLNYDRVLTYTDWAAEVVHKTTGSKPAHIPHGIDRSIFWERNRKQARDMFFPRIHRAAQWPKSHITIPDGVLAIGIVATNQARKDWALGIEAAALMKMQGKEIFLWCHSDTLKREWSILELLSEYDLLRESVVTTGTLNDDEMAWCYSAMDVTLGIGRGEGFGYPIFESIACGTPCVHGHYGGAPEFMQDDHLVSPEMLRIEGPWNLLRPVFSSAKFAQAAIKAANKRIPFPCSKLDWINVWPRWKTWIEEGLK